jgi:hypothetical protein
MTEHDVPRLFLRQLLELAGDAFGDAAEPLDPSERGF